MNNLPIDLTPADLSAAVFVAPGAVVIGRVKVGPGVSIWYGAVLRGDVAPIELGEDTNIQDGAVLHGDPDFPVILGRRVTVGHRAVIHGALIESHCLIGIGAVVLNGATIGEGSTVAAGAVVTKPVPPGSLVVGVPGRVIRSLSSAEIGEHIAHALSYRALAERYRSVGLG